ncbi:MAG: DUF4886 domain-containing protein [Verrucomicrobiota bacterium]
MFRTLLTLVLAITLAFPAHAERDSLKLLAIGNSFSNDATRQLPQVAKAGGKDLLLGRASIGGCSLERHARHLAEARAGDAKGRAYHGFDDPKTGNKRSVTLIEALQSAEWDIVTLQQVSHQSYKRESFQPHLDQLIAAIREHAPSAEILIHQTWAYREDHPFFKRDDGFTPLKMYEGLTANYRAIAQEKDFRILPVGDALHLARQTPRWTYTPDPDFDFADPPAGQLPDQRTSLQVGWRWTKNKAGEPVLGLDAIHCNPAGQYLGANVWYATLFETDTLPDGFTPPGLAPEDTADLRTHALAAVVAQREREAAVPVATN